MPRPTHSAFDRGMGISLDFAHLCDILKTDRNKVIALFKEKKKTQTPNSLDYLNKESCWALPWVWVLNVCAADGRILSSSRN